MTKITENKIRNGETKLHSITNLHSKGNNQDREGRFTENEKLFGYYVSETKISIQEI